MVTKSISKQGKNILENMARTVLNTDHTSMKDDNNKFHSLVGPALTWENGTEEYWIHGYPFFANKNEWEWCVKHIEHLDFSMAGKMTILDQNLETEYNLRFA